MGTDPVNDGFQVNLTGEDDHLVLTYQLFPEVFAQQKQHEGLYILLTTVPKEKMSALDVFHAYKRQFGVEDSFRTLKNPLKIRPLFVHKTERLQALIFIIMLALIVYSLLELLLVRNGLHYSLQRALQLLSSLVLVQLLLPDQELSFQIAPPECRDPLILTTFNWLTIHEWALEKILHRYTGLKLPSNLIK